MKVVWEAANAGAVGEAPLFEGPVFLMVHFHFHDRRAGDASNLLKAIEDALNGKRVELEKEATLPRWPRPVATLEDMEAATYPKGHQLWLGRAWEDDRRVVGVQAFKTFAPEDGPAPFPEPFAEVMVAPAGDWFTLDMCAEGQKSVMESGQAEWS